MTQNMKEPAVTDMNAEKPQQQYQLICFHNPATATGRKGWERSAPVGKKRKTNTLPGPEWPALGAHGLQKAAGNPGPGDPGQPPGCTYTGMSGPNPTVRHAESGQAGASSRSPSAASQDSVPDGAEGMLLPLDPEGREGTPMEETEGADTNRKGHPAAGEPGDGSL